MATEHLTTSDKSTNTSQINPTKQKALIQTVDNPPLTTQFRYSKNIQRHCREGNKTTLLELSNEIVREDKRISELSNKIVREDKRISELSTLTRYIGKNCN